MSAVRMVAYGVLEMKHKDHLDWMAKQSQADSERVRKEDFERDQLRKLVNDELKRYGLMLTRSIAQKGSGWKTRQNAHTLYGQMQGLGTGFPNRPMLCEGSFKFCCEVAAKILDDLDKSQIPDTATGSD